MLYPGVTQTVTRTVLSPWHLYVLEPVTSTTGSTQTATVYKLCVILENSVWYVNVDQTLLIKLHRPMHYKIGVICVYNAQVFYTLL